jgi:hypothetical protein
MFEKEEIGILISLPFKVVWEQNSGFKGDNLGV